MRERSRQLLSIIFRDREMGEDFQKKKKKRKRGDGEDKRIQEIDNEKAQNIKGLLLESEGIIYLPSTVITSISFILCPL